MFGLTLDTAWLPYEPSAEAPWNRRRAAHLYRRAGFAAHRGELDEAVAAGPQRAVERLMAIESPEAQAFRADAARLAGTFLARGSAEALPPWWLYTMLHTPTPLWEKMTLFWHGHFATSAEKVLDPRLLYAQNELLRTHALGDFGALVRTIARDPAMLIYLDAATNKKTHPNENFAREVMELFCLGLGQYSEHDIRELARCFTGWEIYRGEFRFNRFQHDAGVKTVLGERGALDGDDALRIVLAQPAAPQFICAKLVRFFVTDEEFPDAWIAPLADLFRAHDLRIAPVVETILLSNAFYSDAALGRKVRSPVELGIGLLRALEGTTSLQKLAGETAELGQKLFFPPNVKGWDGGVAWIHAASLLGRANLVRRVVDDPVTKFGGGSLEAYAERMEWRTPKETVDGWIELLLAVEPAAEVRDDLARQFEAQPRRERALRRLVHALGALPEFQLC
jgi:uncharacterized protein (DUF1800 family)